MVAAGYKKTFATNEVEVMAEKKDEPGSDASRSDEDAADKVRADLTKKAEKAIAERHGDPVEKPHEGS